MLKKQSCNYLFKLRSPSFPPFYLNTKWIKCEHVYIPCYKGLTECIGGKNLPNTINKNNNKADYDKSKLRKYITKDISAKMHPVKGMKPWFETESTSGAVTPVWY
jgi:hypothetical protein